MRSEYKHGLAHGTAKLESIRTMCNWTHWARHQPDISVRVTRTWNVYWLQWANLHRGHSSLFLGGAWRIRPICWARLVNFAHSWNISSPAPWHTHTHKQQVSATCCCCWGHSSLLLELGWCSPCCPCLLNALRKTIKPRMHCKHASITKTIIRPLPQDFLPPLTWRHTFLRYSFTAGLGDHWFLASNLRLTECCKKEIGSEWHLWFRPTFASFHFAFPHVSYCRFPSAPSSAAVDVEPLPKETRPRACTIETPCVPMHRLGGRLAKLPWHLRRGPSPMLPQCWPWPACVFAQPVNTGN